MRVSNEQRATPQRFAIHVANSLKPLQTICSASDTSGDIWKDSEFGRLLWWRKRGSGDG